jgi:hypothetical protein
MQREYEAPQLTVVGHAEDVILGSGGVGNDIGGEIQIPELEFADDYNGCTYAFQIPRRRGETLFQEPLEWH